MVGDLDLRFPPASHTMPIQTIDHLDSRYEHAGMTIYGLSSPRLRGGDPRTTMLSLRGGLSRPAARPDVAISDTTSGSRLACEVPRDRGPRFLGAEPPRNDEDVAHHKSPEQASGAMVSGENPYRPRGAGETDSHGFKPKLPLYRS